MADTTVGTVRESIDRVSWGSIIAGVVTVLAISAILSLLGTAIGSSVIDPMSNNPFDGLGTAFGISSAVFLIISFAAGGFVAGRLANIRGFIHGFLSWATATLISMALIGFAAGNIVSGGASAVGSIVSGAGQVTGSVAKGLGNATSSLGDQLSEHFDFDPGSESMLDDQNLQRQVRQVLRDTDTGSLQPEYLSNQAQAAGDDIQAAVRQLASNPSNYEAILNELVEKQKARLDNIQQDIDRDALVNSLASNTDMSESEAEEFVDNAMARLDDGVNQMQQQVDRLDGYVDQAQQELAEAEQSLRESADEAADSLRNSALMAFIAMVIAALISSFAGLLGSKMSARHRRT
ncbi:hypothetical protein GCM10010082_15340 [Kushneria pakistanensis]|uniref:CAP-Gly protein n=1 Tax=Kushneria pakistanensis TaxID=1508770 RepID=A0ABQ3FHK9_9GAMM|nr:CAP-Gly protein [Kushneria pakistanensis]GHC23890.1 hypothetical protein GCM10010082_15340 [Kushneria pakistanensis]